MTTCDCATCSPLPIRMVLCSICGNKRCPHATDHRLGCTNSNEPGQDGSKYGPTRAEEERVTVTHLAAHPKRAIPQSAIEAFGMLADMRIEDFGQPQSFHLRRGKGCCEVWVTFSCTPKFNVNMSVHHQHWPANFKAARKWVKETLGDLQEVKQ